ncbi:nitroreductase family protein [Deinococcus radiophilus]|uniref:Putative NAD(P)H nitroreductase n=1 Tax=Deinococcus radiophilus TaxID=32062 RepID=A0A3S0IB49_9DEIO|nr:nitroreductase [Deinococcus radiophilus]RTR29446.1 nitroreductase [Deinococcus radiophilus]UFA50719.1 nitroreductase [Deinococcus radiophilus]
MTTTASLDTLSAVRQRRTVPLTALSDRPIPEDTLLELLTAAQWAPNHGLTQPWRFAVFTGAGRERLADVLADSLALHKGAESATPEAVETQRTNQLKAPAWIMVAAQTPEGSKLPPFEDDWATAAAIQNLLLAARAVGLGSKWISNAASMHPHTMQALGFEAGCRPIGLIYLGYVDGEWPQGQRGEATDRVRWFRES